MADQYPTLEELIRNEPRSNWRVLVEDRGHRVTIVAPHGGGIEPHTSEIAAFLAGSDYNMFRFEARRPERNGPLHVASERYSHPELDRLLAASVIAISVHGKEPTGPDVGIGGRNERLGALIQDCLRNAGFNAGPEIQSHRSGKSVQNFVNRVTDGGVQLEIVLPLRKRLVSDTALLQGFVGCIREAIGAY
jgi:phage replication-related protein YjqB (UPF0714/DUF867 family)